MAPARRVERRLAHQAVHAGLGAQQAEGVVALDLDGRALDAGGVAGRFVFDLRLEALALGVLQVLAQQHAGPVAGLGATGAGLDVDKGVQRVGRVVEHPAEFELLDVGFERGGVIGNGLQAIEVAVFLRHFEELGVVRQPVGEPVERDDHVVERLLFLAQFLGLLGVVPDVRVFERCVDCPQSFSFGIVVKDTSVNRPYGRSGPRALRRFG
ncbi:hypothetical protein D3C86_796020 [compost metagenome]